MPSVCILQHLECEDLGLIANVLEPCGIEPFYIRTYEGQEVPRTIDSFHGLIIMGGSMGVYEQDRYPFLTDEIAFIRDALQKNKPILGVCLGSQLLASTLGAEVRKGTQKELGWNTVTLTEWAFEDPLWQGLPSQFMGFHWHGDIFDLPKGAIHLASSSRTSFQAFRYGQKAYGFLFHLEVTEENIQDMITSFPDELAQAKVDGVEMVRRIPDFLPNLQNIGKIVFQRWVGLVRT